MSWHAISFEYSIQSFLLLELFFFYNNPFPFYAEHLCSFTVRVCLTPLTLSAPCCRIILLWGSVWIYSFFPPFPDNKSVRALFHAIPLPCCPFHRQYFLILMQVVIDSCFTADRSMILMDLLLFTFHSMPSEPSYGPCGGYCRPISVDLTAFRWETVQLFAFCQCAKKAPLRALPSEVPHPFLFWYFFSTGYLSVSYCLLW